MYNVQCTFPYIIVRFLSEWLEMQLWKACEMAAIVLRKTFVNHPFVNRDVKCTAATAILWIMPRRITHTHIWFTICQGWIYNSKIKYEHFSCMHQIRNSTCSNYYELRSDNRNDTYQPNSQHIHINRKILMLYWAQMFKVNMYIYKFEYFSRHSFRAKCLKLISTMITTILPVDHQWNLRIILNCGTVQIYSTLPSNISVRFFKLMLSFESADSMIWLSIKDKRCNNCDRQITQHNFLLSSLSLPPSLLKAD